MMDDAKLYLAIHGPFVVSALWMCISEWRQKAARIALAGLAAVHLITLLAYFLKLGDDFARATYGGMFFAIPLLLIYLKHVNRENELRRPWLIFPLALVAIPLAGLAGLTLALIITPMDWR